MTRMGQALITMAAFLKQHGVSMESMLKNFVFGGN